MLIHRGDRFQAGRGIGGLFRGLFRGLKPLVSMGLSAGKRFLQSDLMKNVGRTALEMGKDALKNVAADALEGKNVKESLDKELDTAKSRIAQTIRGSGSRKRKKTCKKLPPALLMKKSRFCLLD